MNGPEDITSRLRGDLHARLNLIIQNTPKFWEQMPHRHFTNHGPAHAERILNQKLAQLAQELPPERRLINEEVFIVSAAAWLYEIGMQSPILKPIVAFEYEPGETLTFAQLQQIRAKKHLLTERLIHDSVSANPDAASLQLGLMQPSDEYTHLIAMVCRGCSDETLEQTPEMLPVRGVPVRIRLLVALLRLADQLYIDGSRVNLDIIQRVDLPVEQLTKWWIYQYAQTLPIVNHQIPFHYFLPITQREYLGHIRTLIEDQFDHRKNHVVEFLWKQGLHLVPGDTPTFQFDQPARFLREMKHEVTLYLRDHIVPKQIYGDELAIPAMRAGDQSLLVLDYENFVLQLGREGYFFSREEISRLLITLLSETSTQSSGGVRGVAVGHWHRADLVDVGDLLTARLYDLLNVEERENPSEKLKQELTHRLQSADAPSHVILVAPREDFAPTARGLSDNKNKWSISAWISHLSDADIYRVAVRNHKYVSNILQLPAVTKPGMDKLENGQIACILRLDDCMHRHADGLVLDDISTLLEQVEAIDGQSDWWRLWLIHQGIIVPDGSSAHALFRLNDEHTAVVRMRNQRAEVIKILLAQPQTDVGVRQEHLTTKLRQTFPLLNTEQAVNFLERLKEEEIVRRDARPRSPDQQPVWHLNPSHACVIALNAPSYLRHFILALDHVLIKEGHSHLPEHALSRRLASYLDGNVIEIVYDLALNQGWLRRRESDEQRRDGGGLVVYVNLPDRHAQVGATLRDRDILLNLLDYKSARSGMTRNILWQKLRSIRSFTLAEAEFEQLLKLLERDAVLEITHDSQAPQQTVIRLNLETLLTQRLLGRMHIWGLLRNLRLMGASSADRQKPCSELLERLSKFVTNHDRQRAGWTLDYACAIKLVTIEGDQLYLNSHSFVRQLDQRERATCDAIAGLVKSMARPGHDGWVPRYAVLQKMDEDMQFGYARDEHDYWLDQTIFRAKLLEKKREDGGDRQEFVRIIKRI